MKKFDTYFQPEKDTPIKSPNRKNQSNKMQKKTSFSDRNDPSLTEFERENCGKGAHLPKLRPRRKKKISLGQKLALFTCKCLHCGKWVVRASHKGDPRRNPCRCIRRNRNNRIPWKTTERELYLCFCIKGCSGSKLPEGKVWCACLFFG